MEAVTISEVSELSRVWVRTKNFLGSEYSMDSVRAVKVEIVLADRRVEAATSALANHTKLAEQRIFVAVIDRTVPIGAAEPRGKRHAETEPTKNAESNKTHK